MKDRRKITYNLIVGVLGQVAAVVLGMIVPKLVLTNYGSEVNGLLSSVTNIYAYIAIVESGIAAASCQALYDPIAGNARGRINAVLAATHRYYQKTGLIYFGLVLAFAAIYPLSIRTEIPYTSIVLIILFNGIGNVVNYFFHGKYLILLKADGKNYIRTGMEMVTNALKQVMKIVFIGLGYDVVSVQLAAMLVSFLQMAYITGYIRKHYSWIDLKAEPDLGAISQSKHVVVHELNYFLTSNVDTLLLTYFTDLKTVSVYALYNMLYGMIYRVLKTVRDAVEYKIANLFFGDRKRFDSIFRAFEVYYITFAFSLFSIANYFILPFIAVYTRDVYDVSYVEPSLPILFAMIGLLAAGRYPSSAMIHISGHFRQTQKGATIDTMINLIVSVILVQRYGIVGTLLGTIAALLYHAIYLVQYVDRNILEKSSLDTYRCWAINSALFLFITYLNRFVIVPLDSFAKIFAFCVPYALCVMAVYFGVVSLCEPKTFRCLTRMMKTGGRR